MVTTSHPVCDETIAILSCQTLTVVLRDVADRDLCDLPSLTGSSITTPAIRSRAELCVVTVEMGAPQQVHRGVGSGKR